MWPWVPSPIEHACSLPVLPWPRRHGPDSNTSRVGSPPWTITGAFIRPSGLSGTGHWVLSGVGPTWKACPGARDWIQGCASEDGLLTTEKGPGVPVGGRQLADVLGPVAHDTGEVACVAQAAHHDAMQVHGLDEVAEQRALQAQHVPPGGRWGSGPGCLARVTWQWAGPAPVTQGVRWALGCFDFRGPEQSMRLQNESCSGCVSASASKVDMALVRLSPKFGWNKFLRMCYLRQDSVVSILNNVLKIHPPSAA